MTRAAWHDLTGHRIEGGSTITQQLARRLYLTPERSLKRKVQEALLAIWLELRLSKKQILARYLNGLFRRRRLRHRRGGEALLRQERRGAVAQRGRHAGGTDPRAVRARARPQSCRRATASRARSHRHGGERRGHAATSRGSATTARGAARPVEASPGGSYFIDATAAEVKALTGSTAADLTVRTTLNPQMQQIAESVIAKRLDATGKAKNIHQAALVAMAPDGAILAMVGGRDYNESQFNRVTQARRQPGSLFKAFVYLAALRKGYTPNSTIVDQPINVGDWEPDNYGDRFYGPVTLRTAFAHSLNSVAVQLAEAVAFPP